MTTWPSTIPHEFKREGYQETFANTSIVTSMETGPPKRRRRFTAGVKSFKGLITMTDAEVALLETFFYDTIKQVEEFDFTHPRLATTVSVVFKEVPAISYDSPNVWQVNIHLEVQP